VAATAPRGPFAGLLRLVHWLRTQGGQRVADIVIVITVAALSAAAALWVGGLTPVRFVENLTYDLRVAMTAPDPQNDFVIIKVDDMALNAMRDASPCHCLAPLDKNWLGDVIVALDRKGVRAVGVDYLLDIWASDDEYRSFQQKMSTVKAPVTAVVDPALKPGTDFPVVKGLRYADARVLLSPDYDDVVRVYDPAPPGMPALAADVAHALGVKTPTKPFDIRYRQPARDATAENAGAIGPAYSAAVVDILPEQFIKGKIAFIGRVTRAATTTDETPDEDLHTTPLRFLRGHEGGTPGVEVHVHALSQMMKGDMITIPGWGWVALTVGLASLVGAMLGRSTQRWWISLGVLVLAIAAGVAAIVGVYLAQQLMVPVTTPAMGFAFAFFVMSRLAAAELQNQRAFYSSTLERYLAPQVIDRMVEGGEAVTIGAQEREITVMISDLENFSNLVASLDLETFSGVINEYFDGIIDLLWKHEAMIDKMTGDGIIAIFGAPVATTDHADRAIACAREIDVFGQTIKAQMIARGIKFGNTRMGLSSGIGLVGNFGGERRFNYTAYGEVVVIAARLEAANKTFGTRILFSDETLRLAKNPVDVRPVGEIDLKGVPVPIAAYTTGEDVVPES
jgi:adenylate cyclase